jgi:hypothetical protein
MKKTIHQIQLVVSTAIATLLISASTVAQPHSVVISSSDLTTSEPGLATVTGDRYAFTMTLPKQGGRFSRLSFSLARLDQENAIVPLPFDLKNTIARIDETSTLSIQQTSIDETGTVWVEFASPVPAQTMMTISFKARKPLSSGRYGYSIAAYPEARTAAVFVSDGVLISP